ncbi:hypothetical protein ABE142_16395 [Paenibacillus alvei]
MTSKLDYTRTSLCWVIFGQGFVPHGGGVGFEGKTTANEHLPPP